MLCYPEREAPPPYGCVCIQRKGRMGIQRRIMRDVINAVPYGIEFRQWKGRIKIRHPVQVNPMPYYFSLRQVR